MGRKKKNDVNEATTETTVAVEAPVAEAQATEKASAPQAETPPETGKRKGKKAKADLTMADLTERYATQMETEGKSAGTISSYTMEMKTACGELGADTKVADLTPEKVLLYFGSDKVNKKRNGKAKSQLSIDKTRRVLRLALVWAAETKLIPNAPLPEAAATH